LLDYDVEEEITRFDEYRQKLAKYAVDGVSFMKDAQDSGKDILVEGANVGKHHFPVQIKILTAWWPSNRVCGLAFLFFSALAQTVASVRKEKE
jgi:hypothetical protein